MSDQTDWAVVRREWRPRWLQAIQEFANLDEQRRRWLDPNNRNPHWSYVEVMCGYFDDCSLSQKSGFGYRRWLTHGVVTPEETEAVSDFHAVADDYRPPNGNDYDDQGILRDPKWHLVAAAAQQAQERLAALLDDPDEKDRLMNSHPQPSWEHWP